MLAAVGSYLLAEPSSPHEGMSPTQLREEALAVERRNRLHPDQPAEVPLITRLLADGEGPVVAVTDFMKSTSLDEPAWSTARLM